MLHPLRSLLWAPPLGKTVHRTVFPSLTLRATGTIAGAGKKDPNWSLRYFERFGYIKKDNNDKKAAWVVLRKIDDVKTKYIRVGEGIKILSNDDKLPNNEI